MAQSFERSKYHFYIEIEKTESSSIDLSTEIYREKFLLEFEHPCPVVKRVAGSFLCVETVRLSTSGFTVEHDFPIRSSPAFFVPRRYIYIYIYRSLKHRVQVRERFRRNLSPLIFASISLSLRLSSSLRFLHTRETDSNGPSVPPIRISIHFTRQTVWRWKRHFT